MAYAHGVLCRRWADSFLYVTMVALEQSDHGDLWDATGNGSGEAQENWNNAKDYAKKLHGVPSKIKVIPAVEAVA